MYKMIKIKETTNLTMHKSWFMYIGFLKGDTNLTKEGSTSGTLHVMHTKGAQLR